MCLHHTASNQPTCDLKTLPQVPLVSRLLILQSTQCVNDRLPSLQTVPVPLNVPDGTSNTPARHQDLHIDVVPGVPLRGRLYSWPEVASHQLSPLCMFPAPVLPRILAQ